MAKGWVAMLVFAVGVPRLGWAGPHARPGPDPAQDPTAATDDPGVGPASGLQLPGAQDAPAGLLGLVRGRKVTADPPIVLRSTGLRGTYQNPLAPRARGTASVAAPVRGNNAIFAAILPKLASGSIVPVLTGAAPVNASASVPTEPRENRPGEMTVHAASLVPKAESMPGIPLVAAAVVPPSNGTTSGGSVNATTPATGTSGGPSGGDTFSISSGTSYGGGNLGRSGGRTHSVTAWNDAPADALVAARIDTSPPPARPDKPVAAPDKPAAPAPAGGSPKAAADSESGKTYLFLPRDKKRPLPSVEALMTAVGGEAERARPVVEGLRASEIGAILKHVHSVGPRETYYREFEKTAGKLDAPITTEEAARIAPSLLAAQAAAEKRGTKLTPEQLTALAGMMRTIDAFRGTAGLAFTADEMATIATSLSSDYMWKKGPGYQGYYVQLNSSVVDKEYCVRITKLSAEKQSWQKD